MLFNNEAIINWNPLKRCMLIMFASCVLMLSWIFWDVAVLFHPYFAQFVHTHIVPDQIYVKAIFLIISLLLCLLCSLLQHSRIAQKVLPFICVWVFTLTLCRFAYMIGIISPATIAGAVSLGLLGILLFGRLVIYSALIPSMLGLSYLLYLTMQGQFQYAPLFNFAAMGEMHEIHPFWIGSILYFTLPIAIISTLLFDRIIAQWQSREAFFKQLSQLDPLTKTRNRRSLNQHFQNITQQIQQQQKQFGVILLDLDFFKQINDKHGHLKGDEVLTRVADILKKQIRTEDVLGRYGGEEFIIILSDAQLNLSLKIAERCRQALMTLSIDVAEHDPIQITGSFGITMFDGSQSIEQTLHDADLAMYKAKANGRNTIVIA
ncbi:MAG: GGDEF domain-containing protein [Acinetobacter sp.]|nr:MAG: GGDEF domain-containing protein [Acinetobacter sp.]